MTISPADMLCFSLYSTQHAMQAAYKPLLEPLGLTYPQYLVLSALWSNDGCKVGELGGELLLETNTLTPLLKRMETAGLVTRKRDTRDERQVRVHLTADGRAMQDRAAHVPEGFLRATGLSIPQLAALRDQLNAMRETMRAKT
ncbi:MarR family winged helix-turn-helix transcriptional regulator [Pararhodobacter marinus]|uniref:MarR family transcriptional regulator n=1 Tax=Pararhodobacter marinus TaxID=2184063 RepID=A0A2U2C692_9RHOB|nr:MarR family transcriptional regulator [Pararhodobacter marinus]PWE27351.1 MarR family transcriptional regulator [Pararhodobacter marinus]